MTDEIKILSIARQGKKYKVTTTEEDYTLTEDTLLKYLLYKDKVLSEEELEEILKYDEESRLFDKTLNFLSFQSRSVKEVRDYLSKKTDPEVSARIIEKLLALNYLDDRLYSQNAFDYAVRNFRGPRYLEDKLMKSGIEPDLIKEVLSKYDSELEKELIFAYLEKYKDKEKEKPVKKQKLLLMQKLQRAGFRSDAINSCLKITEFTDESADFIDEKIGRMEEKYADLDERKKRERIIRHLLSEGYPYDEILLHLKHEE